jgi:hypothetical protein
LLGLKGDIRGVVGAATERGEGLPDRRSFPLQDLVESLGSSAHSRHFEESSDKRGASIARS